MGICLIYRYLVEHGKELWELKANDSNLINCQIITNINMLIKEHVCYFRLINCPLINLIIECLSKVYIVLFRVLSTISISISISFGDYNIFLLLLVYYSKSNWIYSIAIIYHYNPYTIALQLLMVYSLITLNNAMNIINNVKL